MYTGQVRMVLPVTIRSICAIDSSNWPWGQQNCTLVFGSWTYPDRDMNLVSTDIKLFSLSKRPIKQEPLSLASPFLQSLPDKFSIRVSSSLTQEYYIRLNRLPKDRCSSLFGHFISDEGRKSNNIDF
jgi:hypothetical protein